jgi:ATP-binding cassette subfamily B protein
MIGFRSRYFGAVISVGAAALSKTMTYMLLRYFVDSYFVEGIHTYPLPLIASGFLLLAACEGGFSFISGILASQTAEGVTRRLRNYLYDQIQHLSFTYHSKTPTGELIERCTSDVDALRRFFSDQAISIVESLFYS